MENRGGPNSIDQLERQIGGSWVTWAGFALLLLAIGYFFKYALDREWLSPAIRVGLGAAAGLAAYGVGHSMLGRGYRQAYSLTFMGFGIATLFVSFGSAYFVLDLLNPALGLLLMTAVTSLAVWTAWHYDNQIIGALGLLGALVAPVIFPALHTFVGQRFAYVGAVSLGAVLLSVLRPWPWIRALAWVGAELTLVGYLMMVPNLSGWPLYFGIATAFFGLFTLGLALESLWMRHPSSPWNLALSVGNAIAYAGYTALLIPTESPVLTATLLLSGAFYGVIALLLHRRVPDDTTGAMLHLMAAIAFITFTVPLRLGPVGITIAWTLESLLLWQIGVRWRHRLIRWSGPVLLLVNGLHWWSVAWDVEWVRWFGVTYIPFINPGAIAWILLATAGFLFSVWFEQVEEPGLNRADISTIFALLSHVVVGGLLTVQINNVFEAYPLASAALTHRVNLVTLSVSWGVYALLLVAWGFSRRSALFRWFGLIATGVVLIKVFAVDLAGLETIFKMAALAVLGLIFLAIGYLYQHADRTNAAQSGKERNV